MKIEVIIEPGEGEFWGRIEDKGYFLPCTVADTIEEVCRNLKDLIIDYQENDEKIKDDPFWKDVKVEEVEFVLRYDVSSEQG
jgi:predicted RNase H-like HicB family nuclease